MARPRRTRTGGLRLVGSSFRPPWLTDRQRIPAATVNHIAKNFHSFPQRRELVQFRGANRDTVTPVAAVDRTRSVDAFTPAKKILDWKDGKYGGGFVQTAL